MTGDMKRVVRKVLPDGSTGTVYPFHVSIEGLEKAVLYKDEEDYGVMVKYIAICAKRKNVIVVIYAVVSNHSHVAILSRTQKEADAYSEDIKKMYSQWYSRKYGLAAILRRNDSQALLIGSDWHLRNSLAYIPRNAHDNGASVTEYRWSGFRAMFSKNHESGFPVKNLTRRDKEKIMHTADSLKDVPWMIDGNGDLIPGSFCDSEYLKQVFNHDQAFFLKTIGSLNPASVKEELVDGPRRMMTDNELFNYVNDTSRHWFMEEVTNLPLDKKYRLLSFVYRNRKTSIPQLARVFGLEREKVKAALDR